MSADGADAPARLGIDLRELRAFLTLAQELHFGRTAERLAITGSSVSQTIRLLETRIGGTLFTRTSRRVALTPLGERLAARLKRPYGELADALLDAREVATGVTGDLRIGIYSSVSCGPHMTTIIHTFQTRHPGCEVAFGYTGFEADPVERLHAGEFDMLAIRLPLHSGQITTGPVLSREQRVLLVAEDDPLAGRASVCYDEIADRAVSDVRALPREMMDAFIRSSRRAAGCCGGSPTTASKQP